MECTLSVWYETQPPPPPPTETTFFFPPLCASLCVFLYLYLLFLFSHVYFLQVLLYLFSSSLTIHVWQLNQGKHQTVLLSCFCLCLGFSTVADPLSNQDTKEHTDTHIYTAQRLAPGSALYYKGKSSVGKSMCQLELRQNQKFGFLTIAMQHTHCQISKSEHIKYVLRILLTCLKKENSNSTTKMLICATVDPSVYFIQQVLYIRSFQTVFCLCLSTRSGDSGSLTSRWRPISWAHVNLKSKKPGCVRLCLPAKATAWFVVT